MISNKSVVRWSSWFVMALVILGGFVITINKPAFANDREQNVDLEVVDAPSRNKVPFYAIFGEIDYISPGLEINGLGLAYPSYEFHLWARRNGLQVSKDAEPFINQQLRLLSDQGMVVRLHGLSPTTTYFLYLDLALIQQKKNLVAMQSSAMVLVNGKEVMKLFMPFDIQRSQVLYPVKIKIAPALAAMLFVEIKIVPTSGDARFWAIYDLYVSYSDQALPGKFSGFRGSLK